MPLIELLTFSLAEQASLSDYEKGFCHCLNDCLGIINQFHSRKFFEVEDFLQNNQKETDALPSSQDEELLAVQKNKTRQRVKITQWLSQEKNQAKIKNNDNALYQVAAEVFNYSYLNFAYLEPFELGTVHQMLLRIINIYNEKKVEIKNEKIIKKLEELKQKLTDCLDYMKAALVVEKNNSQTSMNESFVSVPMDGSFVQIKDEKITHDPLIEIILPKFKGILKLPDIDVKELSHGNLSTPLARNPMLEEENEQPPTTYQYFANCIAEHKNNEGVEIGKEWLSANNIDYKDCTNNKKPSPTIVSRLFHWGNNQNETIDKGLEILSNNYYADMITFSYLSGLYEKRQRNKLRSRNKSNQSKREKLFNKNNQVKWQRIREAIFFNDEINLTKWIDHQKRYLATMNQDAQSEEIKKITFEEFINQEVDGLTLLHWAVGLNREGFARLLIEAGARPKSTSNFGTPQEYVKHLQKKQWQYSLMSLIEARDEAGLQSFLEQHKTHKAESLDFVDDDQMSPLLLALFLGENRLYELLTKYANENIKNSNEFTAKEYQAYQTELLKLVEAGDTKKVEAFLSKNGQYAKTWRALAFDFENVEGFTPLLIAASNGDREMYNLLYAKGADVGHANRHGMIPREYAELFLIDEPQKENTQAPPSMLSHCFQALGKIIYGAPEKNQSEETVSAPNKKQEVEESKQDEQPITGQMPPAIESKSQETEIIQQQQAEIEQLKNRVDELQKEVAYAWSTVEEQAKEKEKQEAQTAKIDMLQETIAKAQKMNGYGDKLAIYFTKRAFSNANDFDNTEFNLVDDIEQVYKNIEACFNGLEAFTNAYIAHHSKPLWTRLLLLGQGQGFHGDVGCAQAKAHLAQHLKEKERMLTMFTEGIKKLADGKEKITPKHIELAYQKMLQMIANDVSSYITWGSGNENLYSYKTYVLAYLREIQEYIPTVTVGQIGLRKEGKIIKMKLGGAALFNNDIQGNEQAPNSFNFLINSGIDRVKNDYRKIKEEAAKAKLAATNKNNNR